MLESFAVESKIPSLTHEGGSEGAHFWPSGTNNFDNLDVTRAIFKFDIEEAEEDRAEN